VQNGNSPYAVLLRLHETVGYHNQIELTFAIKDTNKESIINDGGNRIATKMAVGK
jgi:hypothetical protein